MASDPFYKGVNGSSEREIWIFISEVLPVWAGFPLSHAMPTVDFLLKITSQAPADSGCGLGIREDEIGL